MKYLPLLWAGLWRKPARTILTLLSIVVAFVLFGILSGIDAGFARTLQASRLDRLFTDSRFGAPMQIAYAEQIARVPGVAVVAPRRGLYGYYQNPKEGVLVIARDERFFSLRPEITITPAHIAALRQTRTGVVVSVYYHNKYGWKVGDKIPLQTQTPRVDGSQVWTFDVVGIVDDTNYPGQAGWFLCNYEYLDEASASGKGTIDRFLVRIKDPERAVQISHQIDHLFANSASPTRTSSEKSTVQSGLQYLGDMQLFTHAVVGAVFFMLLFVTGNTMLQSVRERVPEIAVLKTLGFSDNAVLRLVIAESVLLCLIAASVGLLVAKLAIPLTRPLIQDFVALLQTGWGDSLRGFALALMVAIISSVYPAWRVRQLTIVDALSRH
ncbi:MAG TPA: ABC transporter permease [Steroidobacteraceae bacterium]|nr:ABC transporter permease [Steroidobacteraceae bacterium]